MQIERDEPGELPPAGITASPPGVLPPAGITASPPGVLPPAGITASPPWLAPAGSSTASAMPPAEHNEAYVVASLGDSYASGEGAIGDGWLDTYCHRSELAASYQAFQRQSALIPPPAKSRFIFLACTGSVTERATSDRKTISGANGQLSKLPPGRIDALILSIGGNDVGFGPIAATCAFAPWFCSGDPQIRSQLLNDMAQLPSKLERTFAAIPTNVRHVFVTEYPDPGTGLFMIRCGNPFLPAFGLLDGITEDEAQWAADNIVSPLNRILRDCVKNANGPGRPQFHFVSGIADRFNTHGYCVGGGGPNLLTIFSPRYISTLLDSLTSQGDEKGALHPNDLGQNEIRDQLLLSMSFLMLEPYISVQTWPGSSVNPTITQGYDVQLQIYVGLRVGLPVGGARVKLDGADIGATDQNGRLNHAWTSDIPGNHLVTAMTNPEAAANVFVYAVENYG
jgi:hypothetical protein